MTIPISPGFSLPISEHVGSLMGCVAEKEGIASFLSDPDEI